jgi:hypothetical protein
VLTFRGQGCSTISVVAMVAHTFGVELSVNMRALIDGPLSLFGLSYCTALLLLYIGHIMIRIYRLRWGFNWRIESNKWTYQFAFVLCLKLKTWQLVEQRDVQSWIDDLWTLALLAVSHLRRGIENFVMTKIKGEVLRIMLTCFLRLNFPHLELPEPWQMRIKFFRCLFIC